MKFSNRKSIYADLYKYCIFADKKDYIELTEWTNQEGFDIDINGKKKISLTTGEIEAIYHLFKSFDYVSEE